MPLYVGSGWLPRHVVLAVAERDRALRVYDPARGRLATVARDEFVVGRLALGRWHTPWFTVAP